MRLLFYKPDFNWPRTSGHDVHTYFMMRAMTRLGARVGVTAMSAPDPRAIAGIDLDLVEALSGHRESTEHVRLTWAQERYRSYWGIEPSRIARLGTLAEQFQADAVVVSGLDVLPLLGAVRHAKRVWYAADEWCWHHLTQVSWRDPHCWENVREAAVKGLYERAYASRLDRVWVVTPQDARAMRWVAGVSGIDILPNGVDAESFQPGDPAVERPWSTVFWGRLDFGPNVQGLEWFCRQVWPLVRHHRPDAQFTIIGFDPGPEARSLATLPGISLLPNVENLAEEVARHSVVVLPFVSGGGIKNKLLEAAAMGKPIVSTPRGLLGLVGTAPVVEAAGAQDFSAAIVRLCSDAAGRRQVGADLREWVKRHHDWSTVAMAALAGLGNGKTLDASMPSFSRVR